IYERLIREFPASPFREQAMADSIPLLNQTGQAERAAARPEEILNRYPGSLQSDRARFWQARRKFDEKKYAETLALLSEVSPDRGLSEAERTEYHRVQGWSLMRSGREQDAGVAFARYLERQDATDNKAPVLMLMAEAHRKAGRMETAFRLYREVAERHPHPDYLREALFRRAEIFSETRLEDRAAPDADQRLAEAIGHFDAYLETGGKKFLAAALRRRAELLNRAGQPQKALGDSDRLAGLGRKYREDLTLLKTRAELLAKLGRPGQAVALLSKAYEDYTLPKQTRSALLVELAAYLYRAGECDRVLERLEPTPVFSEPGLRQRAFFMRGICRFRQGLWEKAALDLETLIEKPDYVESVWPTLLSAYEKSEQHARLARLAEELLASGQMEPSEEIFLKLGRAYEQTGEPTLMVSAFTRLESLNPEAVATAEVQFRLARAEEALGNRDAALTHFRKAATLEDGEPGPAGPFFLQAIEHLQGPLLRREEFAELAALNDRALTRAQDEAQRERVADWRARALIAWAAALGRKGQKGAALEKLEAARGALPAAESSRRLEYLVALAKGFAGQGKYDAAEEMLGEEINQAKDAEFRDQVKQATGRFYLDWAEASEPSDPAKKVIRRYEEALARLPGASWQARYAVALKLDRLYTGESEFARRAAMFAKLTPGVTEPELKKSLLRYRSRIYREWGEHEAAAKKPVAALKRFQQGLALLADSDWEGRYDLTAAMGRVYFGRGNFSELLIIYERVLPEVEDAELKGKVRRYVGQIYLEWAKAAQRKGNRKSQR
ncbi:MAG: tetratricopeptide repeat protein, partial [SAR324 cluster bacterium]|nr:tetratricopeptide repeat protein [SAR324 cluster bacterium]